MHFASRLVSLAERGFPKLTALGELCSRRFAYLVSAVCLAYFALEVGYVLRLPLVMDEFANAGHVHRLVEGVPYRDFSPYKTLLGYYLQLPALLAPSDPFAAMLAVKLEMAALTAVTLALVALRVRRHFPPLAVLGGLLCLLCQSNFLERSGDLRLDMLTSLVGLASLVSLLERRIWSAGLWAGVSLLVAQKGAYFVLALSVAIAADAVRRRRFSELLDVVRVGAAVFGVLFAYIAVWSVIGSFEAVTSSMFLAPRNIAFRELYDLRDFWDQSLERNPFFYSVGLAALLGLLPRALRRDDASPVPLLWFYSLALLGLCIWHKQPWPYFFVHFLPTGWLLIAALIEALPRTPGVLQAFALLLFGMGVVHPLATRVPRVLAQDSSDQKLTVRAGYGFVRPGERYLAGLPMLWARPHVDELSWLDYPRMLRTNEHPEHALAILRAQTPRLIIDNYRIDALGPPFQEELARTHARAGQNLRVYAPELAPGTQRVGYAFGGEYLVRAPEGGQVRVDGGAPLADGARVTLTSGPHDLDVQGSARLLSWSDDAAFQERLRTPAQTLFAGVYTY